MPEGTPVNRQWILVLKDGSIVVDWGDGLYQDIRSGDFVAIQERDISHHVTNEELDWLVKVGRVGAFTNIVVQLHNLPERPQRTIE